MLLTLLACNQVVATNPGLTKDSDTGVVDTDTGVTDSEDTSDTGDTADSGTTTDTFAQDTGVNPFDCGALSSPQPTGTLPDVLALLPALAFDQEGFEFAVTKAVEYRVEGSGTCDPLLTDGSGRSILSGDCTTEDGKIYSGFATVQVTEAMWTYHFEDFHFEMSGDEGTMSFSVNGDAVWDPNGVQDIDVHYSLYVTGNYPGASGEYVRNQDMTRTRKGQAGEGYLWIIDSTTSGLGEACFVADYEQDAAVCEFEPYGSVSFVGDHVTAAVFDGDVACDACANVTVDGVDQGSICP